MVEACGRRGRRGRPALALGVRDDTRLLEQILLDGRAAERALGREDQSDVLAKARRVVVADRLCVAERLEHRRRVDEHLGDAPPDRAVLVGAPRNVDQVVDE